MRQHLGWIAIVALVAVSGLALALFGRAEPAASLADRTRAVAQQLRCPVCQGESVADSPSPISSAMRAIIRQRLQAGDTPAQITAYMMSRYGNWILLAPPSGGIGGFAWLGPPVLLLIGFLVLAMLVILWRAAGNVPDTETRSAYLERVRAEVERV